MERSEATCKREKKWRSARRGPCSGTSPQPASPLKTARTSRAASISSVRDGRKPSRMERPKPSRTERPKPKGLKATETDGPSPPGRPAAALLQVRIRRRERLAGRSGGTSVMGFATEYAKPAGALWGRPQTCWIARLFLSLKRSLEWRMMRVFSRRRSEAGMDFRSEATIGGAGADPLFLHEEGPAGRRYRVHHYSQGIR